MFRVRPRTGITQSIFVFLVVISVRPHVGITGKEVEQPEITVSRPSPCGDYIKITTYQVMSLVCVRPRMGITEFKK